MCFFFLRVRVLGDRRRVPLAGDRRAGPAAAEGGPPAGGHPRGTTKLTPDAAFPQELLDDLRLVVVAVPLGHGGAQLAELAQQAVLVVGVGQLGRQGAGLAGFGRRRGGGRGRARAAGAAGLGRWWGQTNRVVLL